MNTSYIVEHLKVARDLARADGKPFVAYLIDMAINAVKMTDSNGMKEPSTRSAISGPS